MTTGPMLRRSQYEKDHYEVVGATNVFKGDIQTQQNARGGEVIKIVDGAIRVTTVDDRIRQGAMKQWHARCIKANCGIVLSALGLGAAGVGGGVGLTIMLVIPIIGSVVGGAVLTVAGIVGAVALVQLGISLAFRQQAKKQTNQWRDPVAEIAHHRREAAAQGYPYLKAKKDLRCNAFARGEKTSLALRTMGRYLDKHKNIDSKNEIQKAEFVDEFFKANPLSGANHQDAFGSVDALEANLKKASLMFEHHAGSYHNVVNEAKGRRSGIVKSKDAQLAKANARRDQLVKRLGQQRKKALRKGRSSKSIPNQKAFQHSVNATYNVLQMQLENHFTGVRRGIIQSAEKQTSMVNEWESVRKQLFIPSIGHILEAFVKGRALDENACEIPVQKQILPPDANVTYVFPSFDLSDLKEFDADDIFSLNAAKEKAA